MSFKITYSNPRKRSRRKPQPYNLPTDHPFWKNIPGPSELDSNEQGNYQTPHSEQEDLTELLDDNSPNIAKETSSQAGPSSSSANKTISPISITTKPQTPMEKSKWNSLTPVNTGATGQGAKIQKNASKSNSAGVYLTLELQNSRAKSYIGPTIDNTLGPTTSEGRRRDRPNLRVLDGTVSSIKLTMSKSKGLSLEKSTDSPKPVEGTSEKSKDSPKPVEGTKEVAKPAAPTQGKTIPTIAESKAKAKAPSVQRMTASSFMQQQPKPSQPAQHKTAFTYRAGIPRSFLRAPHQAEIASVPQPYTYPEPVNPQPSQKPPWEKLPSKEPSQLDQTQTWPRASRFDQTTPGYGQVSGPSMNQPNFGLQMFVQTENISSNTDRQQAYSPSDIYADTSINEDNEDAEQQEPDFTDGQAGAKRLSAFQRLGPLAQPKKPKLTINLLCNKDQSVREVVDESKELQAAEKKYMPVSLRPEIQTSTDETVMKYFTLWPWKKNYSSRKTATVRTSKSVMILELEQMEEFYMKDSSYFQVSVTGYPESWEKEDVLDAVLESLKGKSFIPCFIEFTRHECKFLVIRSRLALVTIHKYGFVIRKGDVELVLTISNIGLNINQIEFVPRLILRKRLSMAMEGESELNLKEFTTNHEVSHFIYFPLSRVANQSELMQLQSSVPWALLTKLVLSHNRITSISGLDLSQNTPKLKYLDLSYNYIDKATSLLQCRNLPLNTIYLEGNPLCSDYIQQEHYVKVLKMMFSGLKVIDGVSLTYPGDIPTHKRNYCPVDAAKVVDKLLEVMFPLLDACADDRLLIEDLYYANAVMTVTFMYKMRYGPIYKDYRSLFNRSRVLDEGDLECIEGAGEIAKVINRWPSLEHDPMTFCVDVLHHDEVTTIVGVGGIVKIKSQSLAEVEHLLSFTWTLVLSSPYIIPSDTGYNDFTTIVRVGGIVKITSQSLAEDEHLLSFTRTLVLSSTDGVVYKIHNEMLYWDVPDREKARAAFQITTVKCKNLSLKLESPDEELKEKLVEIFMKLTELERKPSKRCLEARNWHLMDALEYFAKLLRLGNLEPLMKDSQIHI